MENPCFDLLTELEQQLIEIDKDKKSRIDKCSQKITICQQLTKELRNLYFEAHLETPIQEIHFFKEVKPKFFSELHYQMEVFQYYKQKPKGSLKNKSQFINMCLDKASSFMTRHCEFNTYVSMKATHLDELYFTNRDYCPKLHGSLEYPADLIFSSPADPTLSCLLAATRFVQFLKNEKFALKNPTLDPSWEHLKSIEWLGSKTDMVELVYALHSSGSLKGELKDAFAIFEKTFNVDLGNFYRTYTDIKYKKNPTSFLDDLKGGLLEKIRQENQ
ncbi:MAG: RteC domain-containing protein [Ekhidna sp.]|uniref:RteC domain-containing protein n=1 Tax=Ekhidna sp. TaxID=2608089 RepID=UPI00329822A8